MKKVVGASDVLSQRQEFRNVSKLSAIDVASIRLWLDQKVNFKYPANVLAGFESHAGATFFDLNALQVCSHCAQPHAPKQMLSVQMPGMQFSMHSLA